MTAAEQAILRSVDSPAIRTAAAELLAAIIKREARRMPRTHAAWIARIEK